MPRNAMPRNYLTVVLTAAAVVGLPLAASAQSGEATQAGAPEGKSGVRLGAPPGTYIATRLNAASLDADRTVTHEHEGKKITFTPARVTESLSEAAQGHVLGILETEADGSETGLPAGRYAIFAKSVGGEWEAFAELDGLVVKQALSVTADEAKGPADKPGKPEFRVSDGVWCWTTGPYPAPSAWGRYDFRGYWHYYPMEWGRYQTLTVCW
jgi:hypothetical protein